MIQKTISEISQKTGKDIMATFRDFLDYCIESLTPPRPVPDGIDDKSPFFKAFAELQLEYANGIEKEGWHDPLGDLFMVFAKGMVSYRGQFFTPKSICKLMAETALKSEPQGDKTCCGAFGNRWVCSDPTCGSGRNLLAIAAKFADKPRKDLPYFIGEDLDDTCCKMTAINMCVHGLPGEVICHNTLSEPDTCKYGYVINEATYPIYTGIPSIRRFEDQRRFILFRTGNSKNENL